MLAILMLKVRGFGGARRAGPVPLIQVLEGGGGEGQVPGLRAGNYVVPSPHR